MIIFQKSSARTRPNPNLSVMVSVIW